ncbi:MAG: response regulator [Bacteroidetes bacterium]|nr:response regulator [Bacteroidota bacterium]
MKKFKTALIIDDDHDLNMLLKAILEQSIPSVVCALTLLSGIALSAELNPDVIFLDNNLPDGQGINSIAEIKTKAPNATLVMITAMGNSKEAAMRYGADLFLEKPLTSVNIQDVLNKIVLRTDSQV